MRTPRMTRQRGMTLIGFLIAACFLGIVGLAILKIVPLYMQKMRVGTVLEDLQTDLGTGGNSPASIRTAIDDRFYIENLEPLSSDELEISVQGQAYAVRVNRETWAPFFADLHFVVMIDEQVEISR
ncbi:MAG TPA: DUF4845 domain-containing protein [Gammaproteobacteria bacterium]